MFSVSTFYKLEDDFAFQEGVEKGRSIGKEEWKEEGREEGRLKVQKKAAIRLKEFGYEVAFIAHALETSEENVEEFLKEAIIEKMQNETN
jgi:predicted transposase YdaD